jgi:hypothetical protein
LIIFGKKLVEKKIKHCLNLTKITRTLREHVCKFVIISTRILLRMRNVSKKLCREAYVLCQITSFIKLVPFIT